MQGDKEKPKESKTVDSEESSAELKDDQERLEKMRAKEAEYLEELRRQRDTKKVIDTALKNEELASRGHNSHSSRADEEYAFTQDMSGLDIGPPPPSYKASNRSTTRSSSRSSSRLSDRSAHHANGAPQFIGQQSAAYPNDSPWGSPYSTYSPPSAHPSYGMSPHGLSPGYLPFLPGYLGYNINSGNTVVNNTINSNNVSNSNVSTSYLSDGRRTKRKFSLAFSWLIAYFFRQIVSRPAGAQETRVDHGDIAMTKSEYIPL